MNPPPPPRCNCREGHKRPFGEDIEASQTLQTQVYQVNALETQNANMRVQHPAAALPEYTRKPISRPERLSPSTTNQYQSVSPRQNSTGREHPAVAPKVPDEIPHSTPSVYLQEKDDTICDAHNNPHQTQYLQLQATGQMRPLMMHSSQSQGPAVPQHSQLMDQAQMAMPLQPDCVTTPTATLSPNLFRVNLSGRLLTISKRPVNDDQSDDAGPAEKKPKTQIATQGLEVQGFGAKQPEGHASPEFIVIDDSDVTSDQSSLSSPTMTPVSPANHVPMVPITDRFLLGLQDLPISISPEPIEIEERPLGEPHASDTCVANQYSLGNSALVLPESQTLNQLRRNNERLVTRYECLQREIDLVDGRVRVAHAELNFADIILNDLLNSGNLPPPIFDRIFQASERLMCAKSELR